MTMTIRDLCKTCKMSFRYCHSERSPAHNLCAGRSEESQETAQDRLREESFYFIGYQHYKIFRFTQNDS